MYTGNYYQFLGVDEDASQREIKSAFRKLALKYHPDTGSSADSDTFIQLHYIYTLLSDPKQRKSYDDSIHTHNHASKDENQRDESTKEHKQQDNQNKYEDENEDYTHAVFVDGAQAVDSSDTLEYIRVNDYIFYPVKVQQKILFYSYETHDYYRVKVVKIFSRKKNNFNKIPLFVIKVGDMQQIVFEDYFKGYWLSESGYNSLEKLNAVKTFVIGLAVIAILLYGLLSVG